jgi:two-component system cell cycle response regulator DivK
LLPVEIGQVKGKLAKLYHLTYKVFKGDVEMKTVSVVDDNHDNSLLIQLILEEKYQVTVFDNGPDALDAFHQSPPDLVLMDISLPGMDGIEVLKHMRSDEKLKKIPVIALTAHAMHGDLEKYIVYGFDQYVAKPIVDEEILFKAIEDLLPFDT